MKKKDLQAWHQKSRKELEKAIEKAREELVKLRVDFGSGKLKNPHQLGAKRQDLARLKTILRKKELTETEVVSKPEEAKK